MFEKELKQDSIKTGNKDLDKLCISKKGMFRLFCTDEYKTYLMRMVNSFVIETLNNSKRVLIISPDPNGIIRNFLKVVEQKYPQSNLSWFYDKKLYFCECMSTDNIIALTNLTKKIKSKIADLNIDILYIPYLEDLLQNYCTNSQMSSINHLYNFAFDTNICIVSTLSSFDYHECKTDDSLFYPQHKLDIPVLKKILPQEAMYITSFFGNVANFDNWSVWDYINDTPSTVNIHSLNDFYTFDSISINSKKINDKKYMNNT